MNKLPVKEFVYFEKEIKAPNEARISLVNRPFFYGESIFTTMRTFNGRPLFLKDHLSRLKKSVNFLYPQSRHQWPILKKEIMSILEDTSKFYLNDDYRIRITLYANFDEDGPSLNSIDKDLKFFIWFKECSLPFCNGPAISLCCGERYGGDSFPNFLKAGNYLGPILSLGWARQKGFDDIVLLVNNKVTECSTSNIFIYSNGIIKTPPVGHFVLDGILRKKLIKSIKLDGSKIHVVGLTLDDIRSAEEVWTTNSVGGIRRVHRFENVKYTSSKKMLRLCGLFLREIFDSRIDSL